MIATPVKTEWLAEAFYVQASFLENMGLRVPDAVRKKPAFREEGLLNFYANF
jgi:hypothetical protein